MTVERDSERDHERSGGHRSKFRMNVEEPITMTGIRNEEIRRRRRVTDIANRYVLEWRPQVGKRSVGRPLTRWTDDLAAFNRSNWRWEKPMSNSGRSTSDGDDHNDERESCPASVCTAYINFKRSEALSSRLSKSASELSCASPAPRSPPPRARSAHHHAPLSVVHRTQHFFTNLKESVAKIVTAVKHSELSCSGVRWTQHFFTNLKTSYGRHGEWGLWRDVKKTSADEA
ncbi:hypothetical protein MSG28_012779 [Choristoneura fumiferana]|uniref:Uncharacterized protein n=1 Tax=Choristoneura fumiferana TaxID=7141 RepID=A0ACC0JHZ7_CHOFU|nr:hypothetical protein MSG28_012779 [Choristoneura fumiferana]